MKTAHIVLSEPQEIARAYNDVWNLIGLLYLFGLKSVDFDYPVEQDILDYTTKYRLRSESN